MPRTISSTARINSSSLTEKNDMHISAPQNATTANATPARQPLRLFGTFLLIPYTSAFASTRPRGALDTTLYSVGGIWLQEPIMLLSYVDKKPII